MKTKSQIHPAQFTPICPTDFIGPASRIAAVLMNKAAVLRADRQGTSKILLYGPPGTGKTRLAEYFASLLAGHSTCIESVNGRNVDLNLVRRWQEAGRYLPLYGLFNVKIVNELDTCPPAAQDLLLTYLDEMPNCTAFIGTSNLDLTQLVDRFQTRMQQFKVTAPTSDQITRFLRKWKLSRTDLNSIAVGCGGNVRAALLDAQSILDVQHA